MWSSGSVFLPTGVLLGCNAVAEDTAPVTWFCGCSSSVLVGSSTAGSSIVSFWCFRGRPRFLLELSSFAAVNSASHKSSPSLSSLVLFFEPLANCNLSSLCSSLDNFFGVSFAGGANRRYGHFLLTQVCLSLLVPPNFGLSLQAKHFPQSTALQALQSPHLIFRLYSTAAHS